MAVFAKLRCASVRSCHYAFRRIDGINSMSYRAPAMVGYRMAGPILMISGSGLYKPEEWDAMFDQVANDPAVPQSALLLLDVRASKIELSSLAVKERTENLRAKLGAKLGGAWAILASPQS